MFNVIIGNRKYPAEEGARLLDVLVENGLMSHDGNYCDNGKCGRCMVYKKTEKGLVPIYACQVRITSDIAIKLSDAMVHYRREAVDLASIKKLGLAVDIGTTTLSMRLLDLATGNIKASVIRDNPQKIYGADVISRVDAYLLGNPLDRVIRNIISEFIYGLKIERAVITANTVMAHIFAGADLSGMRTFPFTPDPKLSSLKVYAGSELQPLNNIKEIILLPYAGAYFGSDAVMGAAEILKGKYGGRPSAFIDLGTNSEIAVIYKGQVFCSAAAAGSALLGRYKGSEVVHVISELLNYNFIEYTGKIADGSRNISYMNYTLSQADIRTYQLMKAAIAAGIGLLLKEAGIAETELMHIFISGQFGEHTDIKSLIGGGIVPFAGNAKAHIMGNTSLKGAEDYLIGKLTEADLADCLSRIKYYNLAEHKEFNDIFCEEINF